MRERPDDIVRFDALDAEQWQAHVFDGAQEWFDLFAQFAGTSPWFAGNAIIDDLQRAWALPPESIGYVTAAVNLGFIFGTLVFALLTISDRYPPVRVFFACALACAVANLMLLFAAQTLPGLLVCRSDQPMMSPESMPSS